MAKRSTPLVCEYLENISRKALEKYQPLIREYVKGKKGVYGLYKGDRLRYVGLATDLRRRLKSHLTDRHAQSWDKFSVYFTRNDEHLRELEALVIRIAGPRENRVRGKFAKADNLLGRFRGDISRFQKKELQEILGLDGQSRVQTRRAAKKKVKAKPKARAKGTGRQPTLAAYVKQRFEIRADYKGKRYKAKVRSNGLVYYNGTLYTSPSSAATAITKRAMDGWHFWKVRRKGEWVKLDVLRGS